MSFRTREGISVPAVTADQMREVDRIAVSELGLGILQMMENAGRSLAENVMDMEAPEDGPITILAGTGGNGGGGLACARHLHDRHWPVQVILTRPPDPGSAAGRQLRILRAAGLRPVEATEAARAIGEASLVVDALIGYGLEGSVRGVAAHLIELCNRHARRVLALDVPSGLEATTGQSAGPAVHPTRTLTLALPKTGLRPITGELYLADIGIPPQVFARLGLTYHCPFGQRYWVRLLA